MGWMARMNNVTNPVLIHTALGRGLHGVEGHAMLMDITLTTSALWVCTVLSSKLRWPHVTVY
jgi:hypothetical protein